VYDERGIALSSPVALLSLAAVVLAGVAFVGTSARDKGTNDTAQEVTATQVPTGSTAPTPILEKAKKKTKESPRPRTPRVARQRSDVYVEVYNNSGISGLAGSTANLIAGAGWQVLGSDNWYGAIPASTVYYPGRLHLEARRLAKDLGIGRVKPAISPMGFDRLTVILTADYS